MSSLIHPTAIIDPAAKIAATVEVGAYCVIGTEVVLHDNVKLHSHVVIDGRTEIGEGTEIFPFASIGKKPQDLKYHGEKSTLVIGKNNTIREYVTLHPGTEGGLMETRIGDNNLFMVGVHVAHDCVIGNHVVIANNVSVAGHVTIGDRVIIGGNSAIRQFIRVGKGAMIGGMTGVENDVIPYGLVMCERGMLAGLNLVGLERSGLPKDALNDMRTAYKALFMDDGLFSDRVSQTAQKFSNQNEVQEIITFIEEKTGNALCQPKKK